MTRAFFFGLIGLVIASWIKSGTRTTKGDGIYFSYTNPLKPDPHGGSKRLRLRDLSTYGNFGLGRQEGTGGVIILNGIAYLINQNGSVRRLKSDMHMPTAAIKFFRADRRIVVKRPLTLSNLQFCLDSLMIPCKSAAIKIQGRFDRMKYRSFSVEEGVPGFTERRSFDRQSIQGSMVGFYAPGGTSDLHGAGYHFHFIDRNRTTGGVVEDCMLKDVYIEIDYAQSPRLSESDTARIRTYPLANVLK